MEDGGCKSGDGSGGSGGGVSVVEVVSAWRGDECEVVVQVIGEMLL